MRTTNRERRVAVALVALALLGAATSATRAQELAGTLTIPGDGADLSTGSAANGNRRLGGFFSDLFYDRSANVYYGLPDRGPGGGVISYDARVQKFVLDVNPNTGAVGGFTLLDTITLRDTNGSAAFNGLNPSLLSGNAANLGLSLDPEGFAVGANGNFFVSDEYGPSVYEFRADGTLVRTFATPDNLLPRNDQGGIDYVTGRKTGSNPNGLVSGRQDNRGFEGLTLSPDGKTLYAMLQDPLVNEGPQNDGRRGRNLRIVAFDTATGESKGQFIYQLEDRADINARVPGTDNDFGATQQGRNLGISAVIALNDHELLVLERDNRGLGVDALLESDPVAKATLGAVGSKRVFKIDLTGATDVSSVSLAGGNLPDGVLPVTKTLFLDIQAQLEAAGLVIPEKLEGLTVGPRLADGSYALLIGSDNDFSVTQTGAGVQLDVYTDGTTGPIGGDPNGRTLVPTYLYSFKTALPGFTPAATAVPEPSTLALAGVGLLGLVGGRGLRRRK